MTSSSRLVVGEASLVDLGDFEADSSDAILRRDGRWDVAVSVGSGSGGGGEGGGHDGDTVTALLHAVRHIVTV